MDVKINEERFKKLLFKHLDSNEYLSNAIEHRGNIDGVKQFFYHHDTEEFDDWSDDFVFCYFKTSEDYEDYHNITTPYDSLTYPLIEIDGYYYQEIINLFGDTYAPQFTLEWLNKRYGLDANSIVED
jgi:hypothetical protein